MQNEVPCQLHLVIYRISVLYGLGTFSVLDSQDSLSLRPTWSPSIPSPNPGVRISSTLSRQGSIILHPIQSQILILVQNVYCKGVFIFIIYLSYWLLIFTSFNNPLGWEKELYQGAETSCVCVCTKRVCVKLTVPKVCTVGIYSTYESR